MNTDEMTLNSEATPITPPDTYETPAPPAPSMKWYRAVMAFIWVSAIFYIGYFVPRCLTNMKDKSIVFDSLKILNVILLLFSLVLAVFAYIVWRELHKKSLFAPKLLLIWHILAIVCWVIQLGVILFLAGFDEAITKTVKDVWGHIRKTEYSFVRWSEIQALMAVVCNAVLLVVNHFYFRKRSEVFQNGDGSIGSLFRWQKKPASAEVAENPGETATDKKLPMRRHRVTRIIAWISAAFGACVTCAWLVTLSAWKQEVQYNVYVYYREDSEIFHTMIREGQETRILLVAGLVLLNIAAILYAYVVWSGLLEHRVGTPGRIIPLCVFNLSFWIQLFVKGSCQLYDTEQLEGRFAINFEDVFVFWIVILIHAALAIPGYFYFKKRAHQFEN